MIKKDIRFPFDNEIYLNSIYQGDKVIYKLLLDMSAIGDCQEMVINIYDSKKGIRVFTNPIIDGSCYLPLEKTELTGEYEIYLWAKNSINNAQIHYGKINITVKELIGEI